MFISFVYLFQKDSAAEFPLQSTRSWRVSNSSPTRVGTRTLRPSSRIAPYFASIDEYFLLRLPPTCRAYALAPPVFKWPAGGNIRTYINTQDLIPLLSAGTSQQGNTTTWGADVFNPAFWHSQAEYVNQSGFTRDLRLDMGLPAQINLGAVSSVVEDQIGGTPAPLPREGPNPADAANFRGGVLHKNTAPTFGSLPAPISATQPPKPAKPGLRPPPQSR